MKQRKTLNYSKGILRKKSQGTFILMILCQI